MAGKVVDAEEVKRAFDRAARATQVKILRRALGKALRPTAKRLRAATPAGSRSHRTYKGRLVAPGFLRRNISTTTRAGRDKNRASGTIRPASEAWYGSLLEHGWRPGKRAKKVKAASRKFGSLSDAKLDSLGDKRKKVQGNNWWSNAYQGEEEKIIKRFEDFIFDEILKAWGR
ncbi:MAG: HK97 gp10 family phage protein [Rickettsiales bacterium]